MNVRNFLIAVFAVVLAATLAGMSVYSLAYDEGQEDQRILIDQTLAELKSPTAITVGSSATQMHPSDGTGVGSLTIINASSTCIQCGGSDVTTSVGATVGDGCEFNKVLSMDVARAWCTRVGGSDVTGVRTLYGDR